jgi:surfactin synthase thioesterase subunit
MTTAQHKPGKVRSKTPWFLSEPDPDVPIRIFLFPYSGCGASMFKQWPTRRPSPHGDIDFIPLQFPFRENRTREPHYETYEALADELVPGIRDYLDRPYAFFGHCGGVLPAFEAAVRVAELGYRPPACFVASSQVVPHHGPHGRFLRLSTEELDAEIRMLLGRMTGNANFPEEIIDIVRDVLVADVDANKKYSKPAPITVAPTLLSVGWEQDVEVPHQVMPDWADCADDTEVVLLQGDHYSFLEAPSPLIENIVRVVGAAAKTTDENWKAER